MKKHSKKCQNCRKKAIPENRLKYCDQDCAIAAHQKQIKRLLRRQRSNVGPHVKFVPCEICGYDKYTVYYTDDETSHILCPNHRALVHHEIQTIEELRHEESLDK